MARRRRQPEIIAGRVNADGSIAAGDGFTVSLTGANYTVTFMSGFRLISCPANAVTTTRVIANTASYTERSCIVTTIDASTGSGIATAFSFVAVGVQQ